MYAQLVQALDAILQGCKSQKPAMHVCDVKAHSIKCCFNNGNRIKGA